MFLHPGHLSSFSLGFPLVYPKVPRPLQQRRRSRKPLSGNKKSSAPRYYYLFHAAASLALAAYVFGGLCIT